MYKRQKRKQRRRQRRRRKQQGGFGFGGIGIGLTKNLAPFKLLRGIEKIHEFSKQKGIKNKAKYILKNIKLIKYV